MQNQELNQAVARKLSGSGTLTFDKALDFLANTTSSSEGTLYRSGAGLLRAAHFYDLLGKPQERFRSVHVAGTSGKGSVVHILSHLLKAHGFRVGTFVSPHVYDIRERILVDLAMLSPRAFATAVQEIMPSLAAMRGSRHGMPSRYELINSVAFEVFAAEQVDYAVLETGLGGLYDSTNTIERPDKLALITALGLDHTDILGDTLGKIAKQKAGIFPHRGQALAWQPADSEARHGLESVAGARSAQLHFASAQDFTYKSTASDGIVFDYHSPSLVMKNLHLSLHGAYQAQNAALALRALEMLAERDGFAIDETAVRSAFTQISIPGRFEARSMFGQRVIFDGAHNVQKIAALTGALRETGVTQAHWVLALKKSKDASNILELIAPFAKTLHVTAYAETRQGVHVHPSPPKELAALARQYGIRHVMPHEDNLDALRAACDMSTDKCPAVVTGSFYLLGELNERMYRL